MVANGVPSQKMRRFYRNAHGELVLSLARRVRLCLACAFTEKANREEKKMSCCWGRSRKISSNDSFLFVSVDFHRRLLALLPNNFKHRVTTVTVSLPLKMFTVLSSVF